MSQTAIERYTEAEVKCLHCGCIAGLLRQHPGVPGPPATFQNGHGGPPIVVKNLRALRCERCGGPVYTDEFEVRYVYPKVDTLEDRPRRGRPPKWLVEERRARESALESA